MTGLGDCRSAAALRGCVGAFVVLTACGAGTASPGDGTVPAEPVPSVGMPVETAIAPEFNPVPLTEGDATLPLEAFPESYARALCELMIECPIGYYALDRALYGDVERCSIAMRQQLLARLTAMQEAALDGRFKYDATAAAHCVLELARACGVVSLEMAEYGLRTLCGGVFDGNVPPGGNCNAHEECYGDARCSPGTGCAGSCIRLVPLEGPCASDSDCSSVGVHGVYCEDETCRALTRAGDASLGEPCAATGALETTFGECAEGVCSIHRTHEAHTAICELPVLIGEACTSEGHVCEAGAYCLPGPQSTRSCQPRTLANEEGAFCSETVLCDALEHLSCVDGECLKMGDGREGSWCLPGSQSGCRDGTRCAAGGPAEGTCQPPGEDGATNAAHCASDSYDSNGVCAPRYCSDALHPSSTNEASR